MPDFAYTARDLSGQRVTGTLTAPSERDVLAALSARALFPVEVTTDTGPTLAIKSRRIKPQLMAIAYGQLAALLRSGVPLLRSLGVLRDQSSHKGLKEVLTQVYAKVEEGSTLAEAMQRHPRAFSEMAINMVRAGGEGGFLEDALDRVATFTEQQEELKGRTVGALAYPVFLSVVGVIVVTVLIVFFVPNFEPLFKALKERGQLPALTEWLLAISHAASGPWGLAVLGVAVVAAIVVNTRYSGDAGRLAKDQLKLRIPVAGKIFLQLAVSRFCRVLGTLLKNGVPILRSLEISGAAAGNRVLANAVKDAAENVTAGQSLAAPLAKCGYFPRDVVEMISVAEESNTLESVLLNISDTLDRRTWRQLDLMVRLLEPIMLLVLAVVVLLVAIALLLPVMRMGMMVK